ncbi:mitochondrial ribosomal protein L36 isoform X2 [Oratosquilla oratoria]|uniref:mitochondrial ribosomal protein L36 isoform X2 n=1 Tax=Oratosquilla oratoria TaxID=337810 RepID=UPI003F767A25
MASDHLNSSFTWFRFVTRMNVLSWLMPRGVTGSFRTVLQTSCRSFHVLNSMKSTSGSSFTVTPGTGYALSNTTIAQPQLPTLVPACGMKQVGKVQKRCADCYLVMRKGRLYNMCKTKPRHKQMSMVKKEKNTWVITHASMSPKRPW